MLRISQLRASPQPPSHRGGQYYITGNSKTYQEIKDVQQSLKKNQTKAEVIIWEYLKNKKIGYKIRRQHITDSFIVDFICLEKQVIIEIDGGVHNEQKEHDVLRAEKLEELGFTIIRFSNEEVINNPEKVAKDIQVFIDTKECNMPPSMGGGLGGGL